MASTDPVLDRPLILKFLLLSLGLFCSVLLEGQILLNEACSDNKSVIQDEFGEYSDWIEFYNAGSQSVNLEGYYLSDDPDHPLKWQFPQISLDPGSFLLVFASDEEVYDIFAHTNFKLSKNGETILFSFPDGTEADKITLPALDEDLSFGRHQDAHADWSYFNEPSPGLSNNNAQPFTKAPPPEFSAPESFHDNPVTLEISSEIVEAQVYYTLDGSLPDENANLYAAPLSIDTTTVIRALVIGPGLLPSNIKTQTFFINETHSLPVLALSTDPFHLYDWEEGIFALGPEADSVYPFLGANFWKDIEIPAFFEYFNENKDRVLEYPLGAKVHGGRSARSHPMKPVRLLAKSEYGTEKIEYPFFYNKTNESFERLVLRNASGDYNAGHMRDAFLSRYMIDEKLDLDVLAYRPVVVYINGYYYGVMSLREKSDARYLRDNYGIDPDNVDLLEEDTLIINGDFAIMDMHQAFVENNDLSVSSNFEKAASLFDVKNIADYFSVQTIVNNTDWPNNNIKYWRERKDSAKWRYILFDMDPALGRYVWSISDVNSFGNKMKKDYIRHIRLFKSLLENRSYRHYFINRYADLLNTTFKTEELTHEIERSRDILDPEMERHLHRWSADYNNWHEVEIPKMISFTEERPDLAREYLREYFDLDGVFSLSLKTYPENAGSIQINTITPDVLPWNGFYFMGVPVTLTIKPNPGFEFSHWEFSLSDEQIMNLTFDYTFQQDETIVAVFKNVRDSNDLQISPNPSNLFIDLSFEWPKRKPVKILIYDYSGKHVKTIDPGVFTSGNHQFRIGIEDLHPGIYILRLGPNANDSIRFLKY